MGSRSTLNAGRIISYHHRSKLRHGPGGGGGGGASGSEHIPPSSMFAGWSPWPAGKAEPAALRAGEEFGYTPASCHSLSCDGRAGADSLLLPETLCFVNCFWLS